MSRKLTRTLAAAVVTLLSAGAGAGAATAAAGTARPAALPHALSKPRVPTGVYLGVVPIMNHDVGTPLQAATFTAQTGYPPAIVSYYITWNEGLPTGLAGLEDADAIPMINWQCDSPDTTIASGGDDASVVVPMARALKAYGRPVFLRWFWEMNLTKTGNHPLCLGSAGPNGYKLAWIHIWQVFQEQGATNVAFVWAPSISAGNEASAYEYWPASATGISPNPCAQGQCIDWIGGDLYDRTGYDDDFVKYYGKFYDTFTGSTYDGKPMMVSETGATTSTGVDSQENWLDDITKYARSDFPDLHAIVYLDGVGQLGNSFNYTLTPGTPGMAAWKALAASPGMQEYLGPDDVFGFASATGIVHVYGGYTFGDLAGKTLPAKIVGFAFGPDASGYWLVGADGSVYAFGSVAYLGSRHGLPLNKPIVAMAATPDGRGYWLVASDGGIFNYGDAHFYGSTGGLHLNKPIVGMASTGDGHGYWLVASDGGMFAFGDAKFRGSMGGKHLNKPIDGMASDGTGYGYWLVASDGGIFTFGDAHFGGSLAGAGLTSPVASAARDLLNGYYVVLTQSSSVYQFPGGVLVSTAAATSTAVQIATWPLG